MAEQPAVQPQQINRVLHKSNLNHLLAVFALETDGCFRIVFFCHATCSGPVECSSLESHIEI
jgi:hypothetical protein